MDEEANKVLETGRSFLKQIEANLNPNANLKFDYSEGSLELVQNLLAGLNTSIIPENKRFTALIAFAVYIGDIMKAKDPTLEFEVELKEGKKLSEISIKTTKGARASLLSWVTKCSKTPDDDNIVFKYKKALEFFQNSP